MPEDNIIYIMVSHGATLSFCPLLSPSLFGFLVVSFLYSIHILQQMLCESWPLHLLWNFIRNMFLTIRGSYFVALLSPSQNHLALKLKGDHQSYRKHVICCCSWTDLLRFSPSTRHSTLSHSYLNCSSWKWSLNCLWLLLQPWLIVRSVISTVNRENQE